MKIRKYILFFALSLSIMLSCSKNEFEKSYDIDNHYYPLSVGNEWVYAVDTLLISRKGQTRYKSKTFMRERIVAVDDAVYRFERSTRTDTSQKWVVAQYFTLEYSNHRVISNDYFRKVELVFPLSSTAQWNALAYTSPKIKYNFTSDDVEFYKTYSGTSVEVKGAVGDSVIKADDYAIVTHLDDQSAIDKQHDRVIYGKNIGPVRSVFEAYYGQPSNAPIDKSAHYGFRIEKLLLSYTIQ